MSRVVHDDPPHLSSLRPDLPASLDAVVAMALAKRQDDRYATAADMADDLEDVLAGRAAKHAAGPCLVCRADEAARRTGRPGACPRGSRPTRWPRCSTSRRCPWRPPGAAAAPAAQTTPAGASTPVTTGSGRRWLVPAGVMLVLAVLAAGAFVSWRRSSVLDPARLPSGPVVPEEAPTAVADRARPSDPTGSDRRPRPRFRRHPRHRSRRRPDHGSGAHAATRGPGRPAERARPGRPVRSSNRRR